MDDEVIDQTVTTGHYNVRDRVSSLVMVLLEQALDEETTRASCWLETRPSQMKNTETGWRRKEDWREQKAK